MLEEIGDQLRSSRLRAMAAMSAVMRAAPAVVAASTIATSIGTAIASAISAAASAPRGMLHARAEIAANGGATKFLRLAADGFAFERDDDFGRSAGFSCIGGCRALRRFLSGFGRGVQL
ncbi:MAG TPA: hypothetical protein VLW83_00970, partial [Candidatus Acidoferrales bacterium]|nr:hypothetical protein [Candidatus Acidoferrales bacterium]